MKKSSTINTLSGRVQGYIKDGITIFKGVPYASPPIEALRFQPPQVHKGWENILNATEFGPYAPQGFTLLEEMFCFFENQNEDNCLSLNIWTPETDNDLRPVMVYIHGGSFIFGGGADIWYGVDGTQLAQKGNVVVVTLNYRLGAFGFLFIEDQIANIGILDQIAALKWIKKNIEKFGGNPNNITIFGESAGALSALILTSIPLAKGLFHRAIIQSAPIMDTKPIIRSTTKLFQELGIRNGDISALHDLKFKKIINAQNKIILKGLEEGSQEIMDFRPSIDGEIIPIHPIEAIKRGIGRDTDILIGNNKDEVKLWTGPNPLFQNMKMNEISDFLLQRVGKFGDGKLISDKNLCKKFISIYSHDPINKPVDIYDKIDTDFTFRIPAIQVCEGNSQYNPNIYNYIFTWPSPALEGKYGSCHIIEIPFAFGTLGKTGVEWFYGAGKEAELLNEKMMRTWVSFALNGNPNNDLIPEWKSYNVEDRATMFIGKEFKCVSAPNDDERILWDSVLFNY